MEVERDEQARRRAGVPECGADRQRCAMSAPRVTLSERKLSAIYDAIHEPIMQRRIKLLRREMSGLVTLETIHREAIDEMLHDLVDAIYFEVEAALSEHVPARAAPTEDETHE